MCPTLILLVGSLDL